MTDEVEHKIVITFANEGSAIFDLEVIGNIYAYQLLALAGFFEYKGKSKLNAQDIAQAIAEQERQERNSIAISGVKDF